MAFTTIQGSGANDATTFVGTSGVDAILIQNVANPVFLGAQEENDIVTWSSFTQLVSGYTLRGGAGDDNFTDNALANSFTSGFINGNAGEDTFNLGVVSDSTVFGGQDDDVFTAGSSLFNSRLNANAGADTVAVDAASSSSIFGGQGNDGITLGSVAGDSFNATVVQGDNGQDSITLSAGSVYNDATINGNEGNDNINIGAITVFTNSTVFGGAGNDTIAAGAAAVGVVLSGDNGVDNITGSGEADTIFGGAGNDFITGGIEADTLSGGAGANSFIFAAGDTGNVATGVVDVITDWSTTDNISGAAFGAGITTAGAAAGYATYAAALAGADAAGAGTFTAVVGSATSWTLYLFESAGAAAASTAAVQLGTTGQFGTAAFAYAALDAAQIV